MALWVAIMLMTGEVPLTQPSLATPLTATTPCRDAEDFNCITVGHNQAHSSFAETISFTGQVNAYKHVDQSLRVVTHQVSVQVAGCGEGGCVWLDEAWLWVQEGHTPMEERPCFRAGVDSLLELFEELIPNPTHKAKRNRFMGKVGGKGIKPHKGDMRETMPWWHLWMVAEGKSSPIGAAPHLTPHSHCTSQPLHPTTKQPPHPCTSHLCVRLWCV